MAGRSCCLMLQYGMQDSEIWSFNRNWAPNQRNVVRSNVKTVEIIQCLTLPPVLLLLLFLLLPLFLLILLALLLLLQNISLRRKAKMKEMSVGRVCFQRNWVFVCTRIIGILKSLSSAALVFRLDGRNEWRKAFMLSCTGGVRCCLALWYEIWRSKVSIERCRLLANCRVWG
jgi:hypothetical protein